MTIRTKSIKTRIRGENGVRMGGMQSMLEQLEKETPGAAHWILDQVPNDCIFSDVLRGLILDAYHEHQDKE